MTLKLECSRKDLMDAMSLVAPVASTRSPQPLYQTIRLEAKSSELSLTACDGEMWAHRAVLASVDQPGTVCVQAKVLQELVASLPDGAIALERADGQVTLRAGGSDWRLMAHNADDFPMPPNFAASNQLALPIGELRKAVDSVSYAVASDSARMVLTGVLFQYSDGVLTLVATDTHRLAVQRLRKDGIGGEVKAVVPEKALKAIRHLPLDDTETIHIQFDDTRLMVDAGSARVVSQLLAGTYPAWEHVVPKQHTRTWTLDREELMENLKRTLILARDSSNRVRFGGDGGSVVITARSEEKGEAKEELPAVLDNGELEIAFNGRYVLDAVQSMKSDSVVAQMTESSRPAIFRPEGETDDHFCVIMPMALN